jgi:hypothetical protein
MSIRSLALELYRTMKEVEQLEKRVKELAPGTAERAELERQLHGVRAEERRIRSMLDGAKEG